MIIQLCFRLNEEGISADHSISARDLSINWKEKEEKLLVELVIAEYHQSSFLLRSPVKSASEEALQKFESLFYLFEQLKDLHSLGQ